MRLERYDEIVREPRKDTMVDEARKTLREFIESGEDSMMVVPDEGMTQRQCYTALKNAQRNSVFDEVITRSENGIITLNRRY